MFNIPPTDPRELLRRGCLDSVQRMREDLPQRGAEIDRLIGYRLPQIPHGPAFLNREIRVRTGIVFSAQQIEDYQRKTMNEKLWAYLHRGNESTE